MSAKGTLEQMVSGDVFAGKYRLDRKFASGGMGFLWRAWNTQLDVPVAVKVMTGAMADSPEFVARFELEAKSAAQIRSPHVVQIYEHGVHEQLPYMVMELLEGEDLSQRLKREKRLSLIATAKIVRETCKALHRAHEIGIIHRDIKPANVFIARDGDEELVKVLDFGIAKLTQGGGNITATGEIMGTPNYMSPEHIQASNRVDHRADLWSVSVIAFRSLTGHFPFSGQILDVVDHILNRPAPTPSALAPDLSPAVDAFFARALARNIHHRFQSARDLSDALGLLVGRESLMDPSLVPTAPLLPPTHAVPVAAARTREEPTFAERAMPMAAQPAPSPAPEPPMATTADMKTEVFKGPVGQKVESQKAFNTPLPASADQEARLFNRTMPLDLPPELARKMRAAVLAAPPPGAPAASRAVEAAPEPRRISALVWVALALLPVVVAAAAWAWTILGRSQGPSAAPAPAISAH
jgi:eukaryotic-like serine/threonine-protein kinase